MNCVLIRDPRSEFQWSVHRRSSQEARRTGRIDSGRSSADRRQQPSLSRRVTAAAVSRVDAVETVISDAQHA